MISTLAGKGDVIFSDRFNHASIIDGCRLSAAETRIYNNRDLDHLESLLRAPHDGAKLVITDGIFSMEGDAADLPARHDRDEDDRQKAERHGEAERARRKPVAKRYRSGCSGAENDGDRG